MGASLSFIVISNKYFDEIIEKKTCKNCNNLKLYIYIYFYKKIKTCDCKKK